MLRFSGKLGLGLSYTTPQSLESINKQTKDTPFYQFCHRQHITLALHIVLEAVVCSCTRTVLCFYCLNKRNTHLLHSVIISTRFWPWLNPILGIHNHLLKINKTGNPATVCCLFIRAIFK